MAQNTMTKESLIRSLRTIVFVLCICALVYYWGQTRKVSVSLTLRPEISTPAEPVWVDFSIRDAESQKTHATVSAAVNAQSLTQQMVQLRPGIYEVVGQIKDKDGALHNVRQNLIVPNDSAEIDLFLRP